MYKIDLKSQKFGRLKVLDFAYNKNRKSYWKCLCDCGNIKIIESYKLKTGHTKSCGCYAKEVTRNNTITHNKTNTKLYRTWQNMKRRCDNKKTKSYKYYGEKGIRVCDEWLHDFMNFYNWAMQNGYKEELSIDRINVNGNYEPNNCRWVDIETQANNKTNNHFLSYNGKTLTINQWAKELNIPRETIKSRIKYNFSIDKILSK